MLTYIDRCLPGEDLCLGECGPTHGGGAASSGRAAERPSRWLMG